ncbi:MAG: cellulase family glycosylhydrolase [archaeon]
MKTGILLAYIFLSFNFSFAQAVQADTYPIIFNEGFSDSALAIKRWSPYQNFIFAPGYNGNGIMIGLDSAQTKYATTSIPLEGLKGGAIALSANIKAENISQPPNSWNGIKVMLKIAYPGGSAVYPQIPASAGTFDWTNSSIYVPVPDSAQSATLYLGLEKCSGKVWFDDILIRLIRDPRNFPPARDPNIQIDKGHDGIEALRGTMVSTSMKQTDMQVLAGDWKANLIRWQLGGTSYPSGIQTADFDLALEKELALMDNALLWAKQYNIKIIADLHGLSKGCLKTAASENKLMEVWKNIASRYKDNKLIWAYDLANEPDTREGEWGAPGYLAWEDLAEKISREIRKIDSVKPIIIESAFADPTNFSTLKPIDFSIPHIIYSAHFYLPHAFTHQTLYNYTKPYVYPGEIEGRNWDKNVLAEKLAPVKAFQDKYRAAIFIGEFSAIRWAPSNSAYNYLKDCIELFEDNGWDWTYHAFREFDGWSVEHSETQSDHTPTAVPNDRQRLLRTYFSKNVTSVDAKSEERSFSLMQNYPNPFNPATTISYEIQNRSFVELKVRDLLGREITTLVSKEQAPGQYNTYFDASSLPSGMYIYTLQAGSLRQSKKLLLLK